MRLSSSRIQLTKRYPLTISRGTFSGSTNLVVEVTHDGVTGRGEVAPTDVDGWDVERWEATVARWAELVVDRSPLERSAIVADLEADGDVPAAVASALDVATWDWLGARAGLPVWRILGGDRERVVATSLTIGINPPEVVAERVPEILARTGAKILKVKLGQAAGIDADREQFVAAQAAAERSGRQVVWRVDANGGWEPADAVSMSAWLADRGVELVEQPLARGREAELAAVHAASPVPIVADESVRVASEVAALADRVDGINLKLLKCGGIGPALEIIHTARAHHLTVMIGCMGESSLGITAAAQLASFADQLDLDSHLNLLDDPFEGAVLDDGVLRPVDAPGLGVLARTGR